MTTLRQAAQQALEALCSAVEPKKGKVYARGFEPIDCYATHEQAITALREALEQPEQKPMHPELRKMWEDYFDKCFRTQPEQEPVACVGPWHDARLTLIPRYSHQTFERDQPLYANPPAAQPPPEWEAINNILNEYGLQAIDFVADWKAAQRQWQGLTQEEIWKGLTDADWSNIMDRRDTSLDTFQQGVVWAQALLKEKNT